MLTTELTTEKASRSNMAVGPTVRKTVPTTVLGGMVLALVGAGYLQAAGQPPASSPAGGLERTSRIQTSSSLASPPASIYRAVLDRYCVTCHNERLRTANL